ncbi:transposase [Actinokineospora spheciospongiae]|uniref:transposase n=1 Tax=Actinokineospora spheciospongiae TaxID=909613 RepID=UPI000D936A90|nr:transposase [Actinokineospora spheciospongiae]PWW59582.1 hypothetical protein DFQ13_108219 [Actinokineospora spheciospongiae]
MLAVDISPWLRPDGTTCPDRGFCHVHGRGKGEHRMIPGWPYSFVAALETGGTSWTALVDAVRLSPGVDLTAVVALVTSTGELNVLSTYSRRCLP